MTKTDSIGLEIFIFVHVGKLISITFLSFPVVYDKKKNLNDFPYLISKFLGICPFDRVSTI